MTSEPEDRTPYIPGQFLSRACLVKVIQDALDTGVFEPYGECIQVDDSVDCEDVATKVIAYLLRGLPLAQPPCLNAGPKNSPKPLGA